MTTTEEFKTSLSGIVADATAINTNVTVVRANIGTIDKKLDEIKAFIAKLAASGAVSQEQLNEWGAIATTAKEATAAAIDAIAATKNNTDAIVEEVEALDDVEVSPE